MMVGLFVFGVVEVLIYRVSGKKEKRASPLEIKRNGIELRS